MYNNLLYIERGYIMNKRFKIPITIYVTNNMNKEINKIYRLNSLEESKSSIIVRILKEGFKQVYNIDFDEMKKDEIRK
jgi:hypothetical protein